MGIRTLSLHGRRVVRAPLRGTVDGRSEEFQREVNLYVTKTHQNAASSVWLPGISRDIEKMVSDCVTCEKFPRERVEPMKGTQFPLLVTSGSGLLHAQRTHLHGRPACDRLLFS